ncbi:hypothetical protein Tco_0606135 [Tanacetum coccineum]
MIYQNFDETFDDAWDRFNDLLRVASSGFSELHQLDTFYNALNSIDQDSLNSAAGGNFLDKMPRECLKIIESKSKVRQSRNKAVVAKMSTSSSTQAVSSDVAELKDMVFRALFLDRKNPNPSFHTRNSGLNQVAAAANFNKLFGLCLRWSQINSTPGFPPFRILMQIVKTISIEEITSIKQRENNFNQDLPGHWLPPKDDLKVSLPEVVLTIHWDRIVNHDGESRNPNPEPNVAPVVTPVPKASIPFPSRRNDERRQGKS